MIKEMEVYRVNGKIVFTGTWDDGSKDLPGLPQDWVKSVETVEEVSDGTFLAVSDYLARRKYPPIEEQLDYIYHNGIEKWASEMIKPIKDKNPKS